MHSLDGIFSVSGGVKMSQSINFDIACGVYFIKYESRNLMKTLMSSVGGLSKGLLDAIAVLFGNITKWTGFLF